MLKKRIVFFCIMITILLGSSIGLCSTYNHVQSKVDQDYKDFDITDSIINQIVHSSYAIQQDFHKLNNQDTSITQYFNKDDLVKLDESDLNSFNVTIKDYQLLLKESQNLQYFATDLSTNKTLTNTKNDLQSLNNNQDLQKQYRWYVQLTFDKDGNLTSQYQHKNINTDITDDFKARIPDFTAYEEYEYTGEIIEPLNPTDMTIIFAVPQKIVEQDSLLYHINYYSLSSYFKYSVPFIFLASAICTAFILITPIKLIKDTRFIKILSNIKFEILAPIWSVIMVFMMELYPSLIRNTVEHKWSIVYKEFGIESAENFLTPCLNITFWFIFFALIMFLIYMIKYLFDKGIKRYFLENTCLGWLLKKSKYILNKVTDFDLNDDMNRVILKIVLLNFAIITGISFFFVFGIFPALLYSVIIFVILKNKFTDIQNDYEVLLNATRQLSNGNFDETIDQDVGIFNPLKEEFSHIKEGFEKAVNEEVKSQKMKTELISNVSHDLKTPLTSIITYIDLLKSNELSDEDKQNYIQVIDRNSLRLKNLIEDLFEVSKANSGDVKLDFIDVDIVSLIKQAQLECTDKFEEKGLDLRTTFSHEKIICHLDSSKTYRIFENLFINISKYALANTRVYIDIIENEHDVTITFKNISESEMKFNENEIIERFVQGDKSRNASGSGLGLAIVKSFTELQKGQFFVEIDGDLFKSIIIFKK